MTAARGAAGEPYVAVLGDLVGSRDVPDRAALQARLKAILRRLEAQAPVAGARAAGPEITAGDEVQLLLGTAAGARPGFAAIHFLRELAEDLHPVRVAFGVGIGRLDTPLGGPVRELDGPCFHRAREALERAKKDARWAVVAGGSGAGAESVTAILRLTGDLRAAWTDRQCEIIRMRRTTPLQKDVAERLGVSPSVVSEVLRAARHDAIQEAERAAEALLEGAIASGVSP